MRFEDIKRLEPAMQAFVVEVLNTLGRIEKKVDALVYGVEHFEELNDDSIRVPEIKTAAGNPADAGGRS